jgi:hypothetical protein
MEKTHITTRGDVHQKSTERAGKGEDTAMEIATQGKIRKPQGMKEGMRKATKTVSSRQEVIMK